MTEDEIIESGMEMALGYLGDMFKRLSTHKFGAKVQYVCVEQIFTTAILAIVSKQHAPKSEDGEALLTILCDSMKVGLIARWRQGPHKVTKMPTVGGNDMVN
jgi:hypothetical protein